MLVWRIIYHSLRFVYNTVDGIIPIIQFLAADVAIKCQENKHGPVQKKEGKNFSDLAVRFALKP